VSDHAGQQAGIVCPCGGRYEVYLTYRTVPNTVTRYRRCQQCRHRVVTREKVIGRPRRVTSSSPAPPPKKGPDSTPRG